jgi:4,5:9,10-diseco-3-hydroxy-5,9,17-trioxoandrosta-1(10),2-diene-4-oate hydrolase
MSQPRPPTPPFGRTVKLQQGYEMHYLEHGSGPPVVFVHGSGPGVNAHSNFFPNYKVLAAAGYRTVLPDMLGFGWSSKPTGIDYTLELFVATLREFLDQLEIQRCVLVGNSLGGAIAPSASRSSSSWAPGALSRARPTSRCRASREWCRSSSAAGSTAQG